MGQNACIAGITASLAQVTTYYTYPELTPCWGELEVLAQFCGELLCGGTALWNLNKITVQQCAEAPEGCF